MRRILAPLIAVLLVALPSVGAATPRPYIVGPGQAMPGLFNAVQADWPFVALLLPAENICTASVVSPRWVLTAAHCLEGVSASRTRVYPGAYYLYSPGPRVIPDLLLQNPAYNPDTLQWDFGLVRLPSDTQAPPVRLPAPSDDAAIASAEPGGTAAVAGFGLVVDAAGNFPNALQHIPPGLPLVTTAACDAAYGGGIDPATMLCAGGGANPTPDWGTCGGDSGGPLMLPVSGRPTLIGVTSFGIVQGCGFQGVPDGFARVTAGRNWICDVVTTPLSIAATATRDTATVTWTPDTTTCPWRDPVVQVVASPGGATGTANLSTGSARVTGLSAGTTYTLSALVRSATPTGAPAATASVTTEAAPAPPPPPPCSQTFYQQDARTSRNAKAPDGTPAARVVSRLRIFQDPQASCRTALTFIFQDRRTRSRLLQLPGSTLGYRTLQGKDFSAPVISWPTAREFRFTGGDPTGAGRVNARLVLVSFLKRTRSMPSQSNTETLVVRRIPRDPDSPVSAANPLFAQKNAFGTAVGWAVVS